MIDSLVSSPQIKMLEQTLDFTEQRHNVLLGDIANVSTPGYVQKDLSVDDFQKSLQDAVTRREESTNDDYSPKSTQDITFVPGSSQVIAAAKSTVNSVAFHDRGVRNMEYLMSQMADNAMAHNAVAQMLKSRYDQVTRAISMKP
jgi:flagellar basal-body rod protein FlgB